MTKAPSSCTKCGAQAGDLRRQPGGGLRVIFVEAGKDGVARCGDCARAPASAPVEPVAEVRPGSEPSTDDEAPSAALAPCTTCGGTGSDFAKESQPYECGTCNGSGRKP